MQVAPNQQFNVGADPGADYTALINNFSTLERGADNMANVDPLHTWRMQRLGKITASQFNRVKPLVKGAGWTQSAETYLLDLLAEWNTGMPQDNADGSRAIEWGRHYEPEAIQVYQRLTRSRVRPAGFRRLKGSSLIGGTPDGLVGHYGVIEVKCPYTTKNHLRTVLTGKVPDEYIDQVNGHLLITGRKWCDFVSYDPRCTVSRMAIVRVERDDEVLQELQNRLRSFEARLKDGIASMGIKWRSRIKEFK